MASSLLLFDQPKSLADLLLEHQTKQAQLNRVLTADLAALWPLLTKGPPAPVPAAWLLEMVPLIRQYGLAAAAIGGAAYLAYRVLAAPNGYKFTPPTPDPIPTEQIERSLGWATRAVGPEATPETMAAAQTQVSGAAQRLVTNTGRRALVDAVGEDPEARGWYRVPSSRHACAFCRAMTIRGAVYKSEATAGRTANRRFVGDGEFKFHDHCLVGETVVSATSVELAHRRTYQGEVIILRTAAGAEVTITPNHPVLTRRGWVPAGRVCEGDDVVRRVGTYSEIVPGQVPHQDQVPARIEDVWRAHAMDGFVRVPETAEDFHGDGQPWQGDVNVVGPDSEFLRRIDAATAQLGGEQMLPGRRVTSVLDPLFPSGDVDLGLLALAGASDSVMGGGSLSGALLGSHSACAKHAGITASAYRGSGFSEPSVDDVPAHLVALRESQDGLAGLEQIDEFLAGMGESSGRGVTNGRKFDPPSDEGNPQALAIAAQLGADLIERLAGSSSFDRVVDVRRGNHHGYVYNLSTAEGWYDANGLVVSNCECTAAPLFRGQRPHVPEYVHEWDHVYTQATAGEGDKLNAFRRAVEND